MFHVHAGNSHAVYNPSDKPVDWVNFNVKVSTSASPAAGGFPARGTYNISADPTGGFDLGDDRVGVKLEKPAFLHTSQLSKAALRPYAHMNGGKDTVFYRRALGPSDSFPTGLMLITFLYHREHLLEDTSTPGLMRYI